MEAVQISANLDLDLVGINVEQSPPILKVLDHEKASYQSEKKSSGGGGKTKPTKEFKFKAGIAHNDFSRKASDVLKYLKKGHSCLLTITANAASRRQDPDGLDKLVQRLKDEIADAAIQGKFTTNPEMSHATMMLQPNNK
jgi:translation initiation factor IF-3